MLKTKPDLIYIIGSDGAGKTSLAQSLSKILNYPIKHFSAPKSYQDAQDEYYDFVKETEESVICDRFYEGEMIFAPLYRGYDGSDYFGDLEKYISMKFNVLLVRLKPEFEVVLKRLEERGEDFVKPEHFEYCYDKVDEFFETSDLEKITLDSGILNVDELTNIIINHVYKK